jgi:dihydroflavonol-4-reductase
MSPIMKHALVLGATGHIGAHVTQALVNAGVKVRTLCRIPKRLGVLEFLDVEIMLGSVEDRDILKRAMSGCDWVFDCAGYYPGFYAPLQEAIAHGQAHVQTVMQVAKDIGVNRIVFTSSSSAIARSRHRLATEEDVVSPEEYTSLPLYAAVKSAMEAEAQRFASDGVPVVIVNPTLCVGEYDRKPFSGKLLLMYARGELPMYMHYNFNAVYTGDVGRGIVSAAARGRVGERYLLAGHNTTLKAFADMIADAAGVKPPRIKIPFWAAVCVGYASEFTAKIRRQPEARIPVEAVRTTLYGQHANSTKAIQELDYTVTPLPEAVARAVRWFRSQGFLKA